MEKARITRVLKIATSTVFGVLCVLLVGLWARSYQSSDTLLGLKRNTGIGVALVSENGQVVAVRNAPISSLHQISEWSLRSLAPNPERRPLKSRWGFGYVSTRREMGLGVPHWFPVILFATFATIPWLKWRFSLRELLIVMTLVAIILGAAVIAAR